MRRPGPSQNKLPTRRLPFVLAVLWALLVAPPAAGAPANAPTAAPSVAPASVPTAEESIFDESQLHELDIRFEDADWSQRIDGLRDLPADLEIDGSVFERVGARHKGRSTQNISSPKKPFNLTLDAFVDGQTIQGYDSLNLDNGYLDPSQIREVLSYRLMRDFMPAPKASFARLQVDGEYLGLYSLVQQIDRAFLREWFASGEGDLFKAEPFSDDQFFQYRPTLEWEGESLEAYRRRFELKGPPRSAAASDLAYSRVRELSRVLAAPGSAGGVSDADFPEAIATVLNVDGVLWYLAAQNILCNFDSYYFGHNYLLYRSENDGRYHILPWDLNMSLWGYPFAQLGPTRPDDLVRADPLIAAGDAGLPLVSRLLAVPQFRADYLAHYRGLRDAGLDPARIEPLVLGYADIIREAVRSEPHSLHGFAAFERNLSEGVSLNLGFFNRRTVPGILDLTARRYAWLRETAGEPGLVEPDLRLDDFSQWPDVPTHTEPVVVEAAFVGSNLPAELQLIYQVDGGLPVALAMQQDEARWSARIPAQAPRARLRYFLRAALADGRAQFHPAANQVEAWSYRVAGVTLPRQPAGDLVINELQASNNNTIADAAGDFDDWIELYNRGDVPIDLQGYSLSDDADNPWAYALPAMSLAPGAHLLIWADGQPDQGADHAPFRLDRGGESLWLSTTEATLDRVDFGAQDSDTSLGRARDGAEDWAACGQPSPAEANDCRGIGAGRLFLPLLQASGG